MTCWNFSKICSFSICTYKNQILHPQNWMTKKNPVIHMYNLEPFVICTYLYDVCSHIFHGFYFKRSTPDYCLGIQTKKFPTFNCGFHIYLIGGFQKYEHNGFQKAVTDFARLAELAALFCWLQRQILKIIDVSLFQNFN